MDGKKNGPAYGKKVTLQSLDLARPPSDSEIIMAGQLGGALSPEPRMEGQVLKNLSASKQKEARGSDNLLIAKAVQKWNEHKYGEAVLLFKQHRQEFPASQWAGEAELHIGQHALVKGVWNEAIFSFDWIINNAPIGSDIYQKAKVERSIVYMKQGEIQKSMDSFSEVLKNEKDWARITYSESWLHQLSLMKQHLRSIRTCGSRSLAYILKLRGDKKGLEKAKAAQASTDNGFNLEQLMEFSATLGMKSQAVLLTSSDLPKLPAPFIAHYKDQHYVVVQQVVASKYIQVYDPRVGAVATLTPNQFVQQWSGMAVIFAERPSSIKAVSKDQLKTVIGGCCFIPAESSPLGGDCPPFAMPKWKVNPISLNVFIGDVPLWYSNPRGPSIQIQLGYNSQSTDNTCVPFGNKWTFNYASYAKIYVDESGRKRVRITMPGGRVDDYIYDSESNAYTPPAQVNRKLCDVGTSGYDYILELEDGTIYRYGIPDSMPGGTSTLLLSIGDKFNNKVTINHNGQGKVTSIADSLGRECVVSYNSDGYISRIEDPFGRFCTFTYDANGNLVGQTDMGGIAYGYEYDSSSYVKSIITPRGKTEFYMERSNTGTGGGGIYYPNYGDWMGESYRITITHPDKNKEEYFYNAYHYAATGFYAGFTWHRDKEQYKRGAVNRQATTDMDLQSLPRTTYYFGVGSSGNGKISSIRYADGSFTGYGYDGNEMKTMEWQGKDSDYRERYFTYNERSKIKTRTDSRWNTVTYNYADNNLDVTNIVNELNTVVAQFTYGDKRQLASYTDGMGNTTALGYSNYGQLVSATNALGHVTSFEYNSAAQLARVKVEGSVVTSYTYDAVGRVSSVTDANGYTLRYTYDGINRVTKITYPDNTSQQFIWTPIHLDKAIDRQGRVTHFGYDTMDQIISVRDPAGRPIQYERDAVGNLTKLIDANGRATKFDRDALYRVVKKTYADGRYDTYAYDGFGNMTNYVSGISASGTNAVSTTYAYDPNSNLTDITYSGPVATPSVHLDYDATNRRAQMIDGQGTTTYGYNDANRLTTVSSPLAVIVYSYDALNRLKGRTIDGAGNVTAQFDTLGRVSTVSNPLGTFTYGYSGNSSRLTDISNPNGQHTTYRYLPDSGDQRLDQILNQTVGNATLSQFNYTYNTAGQITQWTQQVETNPSMTYTLSYDATDALTRATLAPTASPSAIVKDYTYTYDKGDNRTGEQIDGVPRGATYNEVNQLTGRTAGGPLQVEGSVNEPAVLTVNGKYIGIDADGKFATAIAAVQGTNSFTISATDGSNNTTTKNYVTTVSSVLAADSFTYDDRGNMLTGNGHIYTWDAANRLKTITYSDGTSTAFTYDGYGRRIKIEEKNGSTVTSTKQFLWDGLQIAEERDATNAPTKYYYSQGVYLLPASGLPSPASYYYTRDHLGSVREVVDGSGVLKTRYSYDPFGRMTVTYPASGTPTVASDFGYTGHYTHQKSGLVLAPYRAYDPDLGRWLSRDPMEEGSPDGPQLYNYVLNNPINYLDPWGLAGVSQTHYNSGGVMVHSEVPKPGGGVGNVHIQVGDNKYFFNTKTGGFDGLPKDLANELRNNKKLNNSIRNGVNRVNCEGGGFASKYGGGLGKYLSVIAVALALADATAQADEMANLARDYTDAVNSQDMGRQTTDAARIADIMNGLVPDSGTVALGELLK